MNVLNHCLVTVLYFRMAAGSFKRGGGGSPSRAPATTEDAFWRNYKTYLKNSESRRRGITSENYLAENTVFYSAVAPRILDKDTETLCHEFSSEGQAQTRQYVDTIRESMKDYLSRRKLGEFCSYIAEKMQMPDLQPRSSFQVLRGIECGSKQLDGVQIGQCFQKFERHPEDRVAYLKLIALKRKSSLDQSSRYDFLVALPNFQTGRDVVALWLKEQWIRFYQPE